MSLIDKILFESKVFLVEKKSTYKFGCVMLDLSFPNVSKIHDKIKKEDLYTEKDNDKYGIEKECHITLLYGLHKKVTDEDVENIIDKYKLPAKVKILDVSLFENEKFDVLKFNVSCRLLHSINKKLKTLPFTSEYPDYKPHLTIAYIKKGKGKDYVKLFKEKEFELKPEKISFSKPDGKKSYFKIQIEK